MIKLQDFNVKPMSINVKWTKEAEVELDSIIIDHLKDWTYNCFEDIARVNDLLEANNMTDAMIYLTESKMSKSYKPQRINRYLNPNYSDSLRGLTE